jgi:hypothetical protein
MQQKIDDWETLEMSDFIPILSSEEQKRLKEKELMEANELQLAKDLFGVSLQDTPNVSLQDTPNVSLQDTPNPIIQQNRKRNRRRRKGQMIRNASFDSIEERFGHIQDQLKYKW